MTSRKRVGLFSAPWMQRFVAKWNKRDDIVKPLAGIHFTQNIGYGFQDQDDPKGLLQVEEGIAVNGKLYNGEELNWDLRATQKNWDYYLQNGITLVSLGQAYMFGWIKFQKGDYFSMIKNPSMIGPFLASFGVMGEVYSELNME